MYTTYDFKTKKALKEAVKRWNDHQALASNRVGTVGHLMSQTVQKPKPITVYQPGPFGGNTPKDGKVYLEGPHYPKPHSWYAEATLKDGCVIKVR